MEYGPLVGVCDRLGATSSRLEKTDLLAETLAEGGDLLAELALLLRGRPFASWETDELGVSSSLTLDAVTTTTGIYRERVESWWRGTGDLGGAAARAVENRTQTTLVSDPLDVRRAYETLRGLASREGPGSRERRVASPPPPSGRRTGPRPGRRRRAGRRRRRPVAPTRSRRPSRSTPRRWTPATRA